MLEEPPGVDSEIQTHLNCSKIHRTPVKIWFGEGCTLYPGIRENTRGFGFRQWKAEEKGCIVFSLGLERCRRQGRQENVVLC